MKALLKLLLSAVTLGTSRTHLGLIVLKFGRSTASFKAFLVFFAHIYRHSCDFCFKGREYTLVMSMFPASVGAWAETPNNLVLSLPDDRLKGNKRCLSLIN